MPDHEERISATLRAISDGVRTRPDLVADVRAGALRRRRRRRIAGGTAIAAAAVVVASAVAAGGLRSVAGPENTVGTRGATPSVVESSKPVAPANCRVERLPVPAGHPRSLVTGGDRTGRFLLGRAYGSTGFVSRHPLLIWDNGTLTTVDMPGADEQFTDINSAGTAVGDSFADDDTKRAYVYRDGKLTRLPAPAGSVDARAIGENGTIVGHLGGGAVRPVPLVWRDPDAHGERLPLPAGFPEGTAVDVDADGTILGQVSVANSRGPDGGDHGYLWLPDGTGRPIPMPVIAGRTAPTFWPISIHDGVVFGRASMPESDGSVRFHPLLFDVRTDRFTALTHGFGLVGNGLGWVAGSDRDGLFVATPARRAALPTLVPPDGDPATPEWDTVESMSDDGLVLGGQADDEAGHHQAVRWRCTKVV